MNQLVKKLIDRVAKAKADGKPFVTVRVDTVRKMIETKAYTTFKCDYSYTDDYAWDNANDFGKCEYSHNGALEVAERWMKKGTRCYINVNHPNEISISPYSNLSYTMIIDTEEKKAAKQVETIKNNTTNDIVSESNITVEINFNEEKKGIEIKFSSKPSEQIIQVLKDNKFRWSKRGFWYAKQNNITIACAEGIKNIYDDINTKINNEITESSEQIEVTATNEPAAPVEVEAVTEQTEETFTTEYTIDNKIKVKSITFPFSESPTIERNTTVNSFEQAEKIIQNAALQAPNNGAYDKTDFIIEFSDGQTYSGRIDIQYKHSSTIKPLYNHVMSYINYVIKDQEKGWFTDEQKESYKQLLNNYSFEDEKEIQPSTKQGKVLDFNSKYKAKQEQKETEQMTTHFINNILPYMTNEEIDQLQKAYRGNNESELNKLWSKLMLSTAVKRAAEEVLKQN